jgi:hypothetical protein
MSDAYGETEIKLFACMEIINRWSFSFSKGEKWYDKLFNVKYLPLFHHFKAIYQFPKHIFFVKIVANAPLTIVFEICYLQSSITHIPVYMCTSGIGTNQEVGILFENCCKLRGGQTF